MQVVEVNRELRNVIFKIGKNFLIKGKEVETVLIAMGA